MHKLFNEQGRELDKLIQQNLNEFGFGDWA